MLQGYVHPDFTDVASLLARQIPAPRPGGAALCVFHEGQKVVDLWGGTRNDDGDPWNQDTLALSFSTTKGITATLLHILASRGLLHYDLPVCDYWPEFAQQGKKAITVRQLLCHESGLYNIRDLIKDARLMTDWKHMVGALEQASPSHAPGSRNAYHGLTYGWLIGELVQRIAGRPFAQVLADELTEPLQLDGCFVGLPLSEMNRRAFLIRPKRHSPPKKAERSNWFERGMALYFLLSGFPAETIREGLAPRGISHFDFNDEQTVRACIPAANGMFTARSLATVYAMLASGGVWEGRRYIAVDIFRELSTIQSRARGHVIPVPMHWRLGYHRVFTTRPRTPHAFGHFGFGGSGAWADPSRRLAVALTVNTGIGTPFGDLRILKLNSAIIRAAEKRNPH